MTRAAQLSHETNEHYGPAWLLDGVHKLFRAPPSLDPCSCSKANEVVRAERYYSLSERGEDGRILPWFGDVYLNPPGGGCDFPSIPVPSNRHGRGKKLTHASPGLWWAILAYRWEIGEVRSAVFTMFNLETHRHATGYPTLQPMHFPILQPFERIDFLDSELQEQGSPGHPNMIVYLPPVPLELRPQAPYTLGARVFSPWSAWFLEVFGSRGRVFQ